MGLEFGVKEASLGIGAMLVSVGGRLLIEDAALGLPLVLLALFLFVMGQSITRFEDFPNGNQRITRLETWLVERNMPQRQSVVLPTQAANVAKVETFSRKPQPSNSKNTEPMAQVQK